MKIWTALLSLFFVTSSFLSVPEPAIDGCYSSDYVEISNVKHKNESYSMVTMRRDGGRVNAKYFAAKDFNGKSVHSRYLEWKKYNPSVVLLSSGTYFDNKNDPQGLTIDNGVVVNQSLIYDKMDALTIVYATGGIVVSDLQTGDLSVDGISRKLNIRNNAADLDDFIEWAKKEEATVFQTHLLVFKNQLKVKYGTSSNASRERRFLAVGKDESGKILHVIVHNSSNTTLYNGSNKVLQFLQEFKEMEVIFMINLDTGAQDVFELYNADCTVNKTINGQLEPGRAVNLLAYYFK
ncbi:MAG: hypothetical protein ACOYPR_02175 [Saprospiraceae bacterium]